MTKKNWFLVGTAGALLVVYVIFFTNWFQPQTVKIFHTSRNVHARAVRGAADPNLIFGLGQRLRLTDIKLMPLAEFQSNPKALPLWHLVSDSNSVPVKSFFYGQFIRGLRPAVPGTHPQPLSTNVTYRLIVEAGKIRGEHDFELK
ncbi:MAG TPA: hypothetical protein VFF11_04240 [Candidatus Binatia bacterium]|nr:hypothetical protein [Candidatus Binatia bacterium]